VIEETYFPEDQQWILRNLTTRQFVRSEAIALKPEFIHGPNINVLGFGEIVTSCICWSTSSSINMSDTTNISRGVWAGHCFDITTLARHEDEIHETEWSDVSDEVVREIAASGRVNTAPIGVKQSATSGIRGTDIAVGFVRPRVLLVTKRISVIDP
jgi:hypothetical protein